MKPVFERIYASAHSLFLLPKRETTAQQTSIRTDHASGNRRDGFGGFISTHGASGSSHNEPVAGQEMPVTMNGTVVRSGSRFALRETEGVLYTLDSTGRAWPFEGEDVRVIGKLNASTRLLHIDVIESQVA